MSTPHDPMSSPRPLASHSSRLRVVALVESADHVCCRYRVAALRPALADAGVELEIVSLPRHVWGRVRVYHATRRADAVVVQRRLLPIAELALLRRWAKWMIFDFDDAVWLRDSYSSKGFESRKRTRRFRATVRTVDCVFAGNEYLATEAATHTKAAVTVVPTCVNPAAYPIARHEDPVDGLRLVWIGSASTLQGLERFRDVLNRIGREVPGIRLRLICDRGLTLDHLPVEVVPWSATTESAEIAAADIGIGWVPDDPWSRGKCGLKVLQYQAAGLPVVANPIGVQADMVRDDETGYAATTAEEWVAAVKRLASDVGLRRRLGAAGRRQVEQHYGIDAGVWQWVDALRKQVEDRPWDRRC